MSLFQDSDDPARRPDAPLAERMRPRTLDELVGHAELVGPGTAFRGAIERDELRSVLLWGPPGSGKTTLARIVAGTTRALFRPFSAVLAGIKEVRDVMEDAARVRRATGRRTIVFVDEIHRFNKAQQDAFLPYVEDGTIVLIGATTENPSFEVIAALLSRSRVLRLARLSEADLLAVIDRALADEERGLGGSGVEISADLRGRIGRESQGDARAALNLVELLARSAETGPDGVRRPDPARALEILGRAALYHDRAGEEHYNLASALHKSMRSSDPDAAIYWLARALEAGEDPLFIARRIVRFASEDIGLADPGALAIALSAKDAMHFVGRPEADLALAQAAVYCALAPRSDALTTAWSEALEAIRAGGTDAVPLQLRNAPTALMKAEGYGRDYDHAHARGDAITAMECLPAALAGKRFYRPTDRGFEALLLERLTEWRRARDARRRTTPPDAPDSGGS